MMAPSTPPAVPPDHWSTVPAPLPYWAMILLFGILIAGAGALTLLLAIQRDHDRWHQ